MGRLASEPEDHAATGQQRRPWCTNVLAAAAVIADVIGDCADTIHVALPASTSDKACYVPHDAETDAPEDGAGALATPASLR